MAVPPRTSMTMTGSRTNPAAKQARDKLRVITRETERTLDRLFGDGYTVISPEGLRALVALGTGIPLSEIKEAVDVYVHTREDLYVSVGKHGGIRRK